MALTTINVGASANDASELATTVVSITADPLANCEGAGIWNAWRFTGINIPAGVKITTAYLTVNMTSTSLDEPDVTFYGLDTATPAAFQANNADISGRARTTASVDWSNANAGSGDVQTSDLSAILQELVDSYAPYSSGVIGLCMTSRANDAARDTSITSYDGDTALCARLSFEYALVVSETDNAILGETVAASTDALAISLSEGLTVGETVDAEREGGTPDDLEIAGISDNLALGETAWVGQSYYQKVQRTSPDNLIGYWRLNEVSGANADDSSTQNNDGAYNGVDLANAAGPDGVNAPYFDGTSDFVNIYSAGFVSDFNTLECTIAVWCKVGSADVWTDSTIRYAVSIGSSALTNLFHLRKSATNNQLNITYEAGNVGRGATVTYSGTDWFHIAITVSKSADQVKVYLNGAQQGTTQTGLGEWSGALSSGLCAIGSLSVPVASPWSGWLAHAAVWNMPLSLEQIAALADEDPLFILEAETSDSLTLAESQTVEREDTGQPDREISVSDTLAAADSLPGRYTDEIRLGETLAVTLAVEDYFEASVSDGVNIGESVSASLPDALLSSVTDELVLEESTSASLPDALTASLADAIALGETSASSVPDPLAAGVTDGMSLGESLELALPEIGSITASVADSLELEETATVSIPDSLQVSQSDSLTLGESANVSTSEAGAFTASVADAAALGETTTVSMPAALTAAAADSLTLGEATNVTAGTLPDQDVDVADELSLADAATVSIPSALGASVTDGMTVGEVVTVSMPSALGASVTDSLALSETRTVTVAAAGQIDVDVSDSLALDETVTVSMPGVLLASVSDSLDLAEMTTVSVAAVEDYLVSVADGLTLADAATSSMPDTLTVSRSDALTTSEATVIDVSALITQVYTASVYCNPTPTANVCANPTPAQEVEIG